MTLAIRPLAPADEPDLWDLLYLAIFIPPGAAPPPRNIVEEPRLAHYVRGWGRRDGDSGVGAVDASGRLIGAGWLRLFTVDDPGYGFVDEQTPELTIAVRLAFRGRGVGSRLLQSLLEAAGAHYPRVSLSVSHENAAVRLYRRVGFAVVKDEKDALTMVRTTPAKPPAETSASH